MNVISNIWNGRVGLAKMYWLWGVLSGIPWGLVLSLVTPGSNLAILGLLALVAYYVIVNVGIWRAASQYQGTKAWAILAKVAVAITPISLVIGTLAAIIIPATHQPPSQEQQTIPATQPWGANDKPVSIESDSQPSAGRPNSGIPSSTSSQYAKPPTFESEGWTQESTNSTESGSWLAYDPPGTRYYRDSNRVIYRLYRLCCTNLKQDGTPLTPDGFMPQAPSRDGPFA